MIETFVLGMKRRKAVTTIDIATAEEDVKDFDCACASSRTRLQRVLSKSAWSNPVRLARGSSPELEQTFFTGMGKIDCRAGGDAFVCLFFFPLSAQHAVDQMGCKAHASFQDYCC